MYFNPFQKLNYKRNWKLIFSLTLYFVSSFFLDISWREHFVSLAGLFWQFSSLLFFYPYRSQYTKCSWKVEKQVLERFNNAIKNRNWTEIKLAGKYTECPPILLGTVLFRGCIFGVFSVIDILVCNCERYSKLYQNIIEFDQITRRMSIFGQKTC